MIRALKLNHKELEIRKWTMVLSLLISSYSSAQVTFSNVANLYGLDYNYDETLATYGGGVSLMDRNGDGIDDLSFGTHHLLKPIILNSTGDTLIDPEMEGLVYETNGSRGIIWVDYDNDGDKDLCIANVNGILGFDFVGVAKLYRRDSQTTLVDVTSAAGWSLEPVQCYSASWADYDNDGWLDCYLTNREFSGNSTNILYRNMGDGTFENTTEVAGVVDQNGLTFQSIFFDSDLDGDVDLFVSNDKLYSLNKFYENLGDGSFADRSEESGLGVSIESMGAAIGDYDNDGLLDLYVANTGSSQSSAPEEGNKLFRNMGDNVWTEHAEEMGVEVNKTCWGIHIVDLDNDMDQDLIAVSEEGNNASTTHHDIFIQNDETFQWLNEPNISSEYGRSFGSAIGDIDNDGLYDFVVSNSEIGHHEIWRNGTLNNNHFIKVHLQGTESNRDAIGTLIEVWTAGVKQIKFTLCGNGYLSQDSDNYIFGLGSHEVVDSIRVHWPSGFSNVLVGLAVDHRYHIVEDISTTYLTCGPDFNCNFFTVSCPEDFDQDGMVGVSDFVAFNSFFGSECNDCVFDLDANGVIDIGDFLLLNSAFGEICPTQVQSTELE